MNPSVLLIDNHDSFTYNLAQLLKEAGACVLTVLKYDEIKIEQVDAFDKIIFSPGPGIPSEIPFMGDVLREFSSSKSILGICLGHQAIIEYFGGKLLNMQKVVHGIRSEVALIEPVDSLFKGIPSHFFAGLYHSWVADKEHLPDELRISCQSRDGLIMGISHRELDIRGVQFHPESYMTEYGMTMFRNWLEG